jgi:hypothetical protein
MFILHMICAYIGFGALALSPWIVFGIWYLVIPIALSIFAAFLYDTKQGVFIWNTEVFLIYSTFIVVFPLIVNEVLNAN